MLRLKFPFVGHLAVHRAQEGGLGAAGLIAHLGGFLPVGLSGVAHARYLDVLMKKRQSAANRSGGNLSEG
jgi:hypothetical protein